MLCFRSLGVHCSKVRSLTLDSWEPELLKVRYRSLCNVSLSGCLCNCKSCSDALKESVFKMGKTEFTLNFLWEDWSLSHLQKWTLLSLFQTSIYLYAVLTDLAIFLKFKCTCSLTVILKNHCTSVLKGALSYIFCLFFIWKQLMCELGNSIINHIYEGTCEEQGLRKPGPNSTRSLVSQTYIHT